MASSLKQDKRTIRTINDINMLLNVEKGICGGICHGIHLYGKANNEYPKDHDKIKNRHIFSIWTQIIFTERKCRKSYL